jgi:type I restriction enzyme S subunit
VDSKSGDSKIIKGKQSRTFLPGLVQGYSASGADIWVDAAQYTSEGIVISAVGARCGKTFLASGSWTAIANTHVLTVKPSAPIDHKWLWYLTNDENFWIKSGTAQPFVKVKDTLLREQLIPPIEEQRRIVEILEDHLSRLDKANVETDLDVTLAHLRKAFYSQAVDVLYKEALSVKRLDEVAHVQLGRQRSPSNAAGPNMRPYLRAANVTWSGLDFDDVLEMNFTDKEMDTFRLVSGDILINEASGSAKEVGKPAIFKGEISDCAFQNHLIRIRAAGVSTEYLFGLLFHNAISGAYVAESQGVGINHLGKAKVAQWKIPIVDPKAEALFVEKVSTFENDFLKLRDEIGEVKHRLKTMRRSLLQDAFTGKLVENV